MNPWPRLSFVRLILPLIAGILFYFSLRFSHPILLLLIALPFISFALFVFIPKLREKYKWRRAPGVLIVLTLFLSGILLSWLQSSISDPHHFSLKTEKEELFIGRIVEQPKKTEKSVRTVAAFENRKAFNKWERVSGKALIYFERSDASVKIHTGDRIIIKGPLSPILNNKNPGAFQSADFYATRNIYHKIYLSSGEWALAEPAHGFSIKRIAESSRNRIIGQLQSAGLIGQDLSVAAALIVGYDDEVDPSLMSDYASCGVLHVLAVSGLHVGILYLIVNFLLGFLNKFRQGPWIRMFLVLLVVWSYSLIAGLSPSILRSAVMFSFIIVGKTWKKDSDAVNLLAVSCFFLLLFDVRFIFDIGFQLSYLAVLGILLIQPWLQDLWQPRSWWSAQAWSMITVTLAAQLTTTPLSLFYFHQFPNYFLLTNLFFIPLSTICLVGGLLTVLFSGIPIIGESIAWLFRLLIGFMNSSAGFFGRLPGAVTDQIPMDLAGCLLLYMAIGSFMFFIYFRQARFVLAGLFILVILFGIQIRDEHLSLLRSRLVIFHSYEGADLQFISGKTAYSWCQEGSRRQKDQFMLRPSAIHHRTNKQILSITKKDSSIVSELTLMKLKGVSLALWNNPSVLATIDNNRKDAKYLIVSGKIQSSVSQMLCALRFNKIIADAGVPNRHRIRMEKECRELGIEFYAIAAEGAFIEDL